MNKFPEIDNCELYLCGGAVRDIFMGNEFKDEDYVVLTDLSYDDFLTQLNQDERIKICKADKDFLTIRILFEGRPVDLAFPRKESNYSDHRHPDNVERVKTLEEDSYRRDFTMNAMYMDKTGKILDFHHGCLHIHEEVIRCVKNTKETFEEDYLRMLRAIRFEGQMDMRLSWIIEEYIIDNVLKLKEISGERIREELNKSLNYGWLRTLRWFNYDMCQVLKHHGIRPEFTNKK